MDLPDLRFHAHTIQAVLTFKLGFLPAEVCKDNFIAESSPCYSLAPWGSWLQMTGVTVEIVVP